MIGAVATTSLYAEQLIRQVKAPAMKEAGAVEAPATKGSKKRTATRMHAVPSGIMKAKSVKSHPAPPMAAAETSDLPTIYGSIVDSDNPSFSENGLFSVPTSSGMEFEMLFKMAADASFGGAAADGVYYALYYYSYYDIIEYYYMYAYDIATGECLYYKDLNDNPSVLCPGGMAYDYTTGNIYGIAYNSSLTGEVLAKLSFSENGVTKEVISTIPEDRWFVSFAIDKDGTFYAIDYDTTEGEGILCKIDRTNGAITEIGKTGQSPYYMSSACIDPRSGRMFWTVSPQDGTGFITEVNKTTGQATLIYKFPYNDEVVGIFIPAPEAEDGAPAECTAVSVTPNGASNSATVSFTAPSVLYDGTSLTENVTVYVQANGQTVYSESMAPGASKEVSVDLDAAGLYTFTVYASNTVGDGPKVTIKNVWVGADTPAATTATAAYENGRMTISWLPVNTGINGGSIGSITYMIKDAQGAIIEQNLTGTSYSFDLTAPEEMTEFYYNVYAVSGDLVSAPAQTNTIMLGAIVPPYVADFSKGLDGWTVIDANGDGKKWTVQSDGSVRMEYNSYNAMDDWLITPPVKLLKGKAYNVSFLAYAQSTSYEEKFEVMWGTANEADAMTNTLVAPTAVKVTSASPMQVSQMLIPEADGVYYLGFHGISDANKYNLFFKDIQIEAGMSTGAPGLATDFTTAVDHQGLAWTIAVGFNAPAVDMAGGTLSSLTKVELYRGETLINTWNSVTPGQSLTFTDDSPATGDNTYKVIGYNEEGKGLVAEVTAFAGFGLPPAPEGVTIERTSTVGEVTVTWNPVTLDLNGTSLGAGEVTYMVYNQNGVVVAEDLESTTYTFQAVDEGDQEFVQVTVYATTPAGTGDGTHSDMIIAGTPYDGLDETFADAKTHYIWSYSSIQYGSVRTFDDSFDSEIKSLTGDGGYFGVYASYADDGAMIYSGLVSLEGMENPGLFFYTCNLGDEEQEDLNEIAVAVRTIDETDWTTVMAPKTVAEICGEDEGWSRVFIDLSDYAGQTIQVEFTCVTKTKQYTLLEDIKIASSFAQDLAAESISAPAKVNAGQAYEITVNVRNEGTATSSDFTVEIYADGAMVAAEECQALAPGNSSTATFDFTMSPLATADIEYYAKVLYDMDENPDNNITESLMVTPVVSPLPVAENLSAVLEDDEVALTWDAPNLEGGVAEPVTDDFEDAESFAAEYGDWTFVDVDKSPVGRLEYNVSIPGITPGTTKGSFWVWDNEAISYNVDAHSGNKFLFSLIRNDYGTSNDWAISPELTGDAQTISFYARSYNAGYPEKMAVYYSMGGKDVETDFIMVEDGQVDKVPVDWTEYKYELPEGAKYFAIRCMSQNRYMLMIDDVTYVPAGSTANLEVEGYNIYRNGEKINSALVEETQYVDVPETDGEYTYVVTVVYTDRGESSGSNEAAVSFDTTSVKGMEGAVEIAADGHCIVVRNAEGTHIVVADTAGAVLFSGRGEAHMRINVAPGVYVVKADSRTVKVLVK